MIGVFDSRFCGTFCLVLSFLYILASVVLLALGAPWAQVRSAETIYRTFNFTQPWEHVRYADVIDRPAQSADLRPRKSHSAILVCVAIAGVARSDSNN